MNDIEIIQKCQEGKLNLFSKLYDKYIDEIYKFIYLKTTNKQIAEDIVSESFMSALENINSFKIDEKSNFRAWIYKISYNKFVNFYNKKDKTCDICDYLDLKEEIDIWKDLDDKNKVSEVKKYLWNIKKRDREIMIYRIWNDLSYKEIAEITWVSVDNCKKIVSRTLKDISANFVLFLIMIFLIF